MANILIIDDSPTEVHVFKTMLEKNGHTVFVSETGELGIKKAKDILPDLILMDIVMPGINGFQATRQLATIEETSHIPVIIVTTKDQETDKVWGIRQGAKDYIVKPVKENDLMTRVNAALSGE